VKLAETMGCDFKDREEPINNRTLVTLLYTVDYDWTEFDEIQYGRHATENYSKFIISNFIHKVL
jgi:hypothetical protein